MNIEDEFQLVPFCSCDLISSAQRSGSVCGECADVLVRLLLLIELICAKVLLPKSRFARRTFLARKSPRTSTRVRPGKKELRILSRNPEIAHCDTAARLRRHLLCK